MKLVHNSRMVCHLWANQSQESARNGGGTIYFHGATLCSYGDHFAIAAHLPNGRILWNDASYSITTSRHQSYARQALTSAQCDSRIYVPELRAQHVRELLTYAQGDHMPAVIDACVTAVRDAVGSMASMREGCGPISGAWHKAKRYEASARALLDMLPGKRLRYPLPMLPDALPTGDALRAMIRAVSRVTLLEQAKTAIAGAIDAMQRCHNGIDGDYWEKGNIAGALNTAARQLDVAQTRHVAATGRKSAKVNALLREFAQLQQRLQVFIAEAAEIARRKNATAVADWIAGTRNSIPHDAGTYARIVGDVVETSRGARVPLAHACRLARIARRVIAHGGQSWADGAGPMVGGFRVRSIGADGRTVIGCHEFEAAEAMRMLSILETACVGRAE